jgi:hypothetical protein
MTGLLSGKNNLGLMPSGQDESENESAQNIQEVLKKRREKLAGNKLGLDVDHSDDYNNES